MKINPAPFPAPFLPFFLVVGLLLGGCAQLEPRPELPADVALAPGQATQLDAKVGEAEAAHPGLSGFRLVSDGPEAFFLRWRTALMAERSLDVQAYIWHADLTGLLLAKAVLDAADRGVQVRILADDLDARAKNSAFASLQSHPGIEVRLFNPFASRDGFFGFIAEGLGSFNRIDRRMHNKTWLADNRIALVGGRNLGDEYFGASHEVNFEDLDFIMAGPIVKEISESFDKYWNSEIAYPIGVLDPEAVDAGGLEALRQALEAKYEAQKEGEYASELRATLQPRQLLEGDEAMQWTDDYRFVSDDPRKATGTLGDHPSNVADALFPEIREASFEVNIISPYFVPRDRGTASLVDLADDDLQLKILTNSLAANDVAAVHGGYARHRKELLEGGVELFEIKPLPGKKARSSITGSSGASLHTKAMAIDGEQLFVGSYNLDPRSTSLNCEQGVIVKNVVLAVQLEEIFDRMTSGDRAWNVTLQEGKLSWSDGQETFDSDPKATFGQRFQAWFARVFRLDSQL